MKSAMKILLCSILFSTQLFPKLSWAEEPPKQLTAYSITVDEESSDFENGFWNYQMITENGTSFLLTEDDRYTFLLINGSISPLPILIENGVSFVSLEGICSALACLLRQQGSIISLERNGDTFTLDTASLLLEKNGVTTGIQAERREETIYIPLRQFCSLMGASVTYSKGDLPAMPMAFPWICVDDRTQEISKEQALQQAKEAMELCLKQYTPDETWKEYIDLPQGRKEIQKRIDAMKYMGETASFWVIKGPYLLLVDKTTGTLYYKTGSSKAGHGSYMETLQEVNTAETDIFDPILLQGFFI